MVYYAKSRLGDGSQPTVKEHLQAVSKLAGEFGREVDLEDPARLAGLFHDFGKYGSRFQEVLTHQRERVNHAVCGAVILNNSKGKKGLLPVMEAIRGHHSGLKRLVEKELDACLRSNRPLEIDGKETALAGSKEYGAAMAQFQLDFPDFRLAATKRMPYQDSPDYADRLGDMLTTRMLFSCLVDADYTVSAGDEDPEYQARSEETIFSPQAGLEALDKHLAAIRAASRSDPELNRLRNAVFEACGRAGEWEPGVFNLTAPTGTGKTLALLNFALHHCASWGKRRIIIVLPFLSLTEQSAKEYRNIMPFLLEDTSQSRLSDEERLFSSRWRVPCIVTTSVKFFETLFADRPTDCRRLHNIANSVILFDEAQTLPPAVTAATILAADRLCTRFRCTMVFSSATQPTFSSYYEESDGTRPPIPDSMDGGLMVYDVFDLHDCEVRKKVRPMLSLYHAVMNHGVIQVPPYDSPEVIKGVSLC